MLKVFQDVCRMIALCMGINVINLFWIHEPTMEMPDEFIISRRLNETPMHIQVRLTSEAKYEAK